ncbi:hypothetical protein TERTU_2747 [Teredinibacter turnerae T7901]|uniref:Uncharacterized protein n=1 Tax=Teredinibacter turnerae (strain ATCC 39867 / T7901) TaxID=377629 RepID=C5BMJ6_TERTT|nr:hypothetical protein TERTU_2747 [Teredinibacter turnerae T7901]
MQLTLPHNPGLDQPFAPDFRKINRYDLHNLQLQLAHCGSF